ncbi:MAG: carboxypeptidase-like regulatory domain-containing protein [Verrucomicrobia bacterium]|nr:carboxypeptidase-like regulatory domain-containing protein [Verrucomicrobiota bacterium]
MTNQRLIFTPPAMLTGVVVDPSDKPVPDAEVWVCNACIVRERAEGGMPYAYLKGKPARDAFSTRTAVDGKFAIQGFPTNASADLAVSKPGVCVREPQRDVLGPDNMRCQPGQRDVKLVIEPAGSIEGKVVAVETGQPLPGMSLRPQPIGRSYFGSLDCIRAESGEDGAFRLADLPPGSYELRATFGTNQPPKWVAERVSTSVESGQPTRDVQVTATRGGFLEVGVVGKKDHQPITGAGIGAFKNAYQSGGPHEPHRD